MTVVDLERLRPLVEIMAAERTRDAPHLFEDAVQEGLIAAWSASEAHPEKKPAYYRTAARNGVTSVLRGRSMTGAASRQGRQDAHDLSEPLAKPGDSGEFVVDPVDERAGDALGGVDYKVAVRDAVRRLSGFDRELVYLRFWHDLDWAAVADHFGITKRSVEWRWQTGVRPALRAELEAVLAE